MISSRIILSILLLTFIASYSSAAQCDATGKCKYGGKCGPGNECICPMKCSPQTLNIDINSFYCAPKQGGIPDFFLNICFVLAEACERQEDVPLIKYDITRPFQCEASYESRWRLCSQPEDFMGPCGGSLESGYQHSDAGGICLRDKGTNERRCECPPGKTGPDCQERVIVVPSLSKKREEASACDFIGVSIGASIGAGVLLGMLMFALIRKCWNFLSKKHRTGLKQNKLSYEPSHHTKTSRRESELLWKSADKHSPANHYRVVAITEDNNELAPTHSENFKASERRSKRQRLNGSSKVTREEDANNNSGSNQPHTISKGDKNGSTSVVETRVDIFDTNEFTQGLSEKSCLENDAYTI